VNNNRILWGSDKNGIIFLIGINFIFFIFFKMMFIIFQNNPMTYIAEYKQLMSQFAIPNTFSEFISKLWTLITHFFSHDRFLVLFTNMIWLFSFAYLLQQLVGNRYLVPAYIYGGLTGGIVFIITNLVFPNHNLPFIGATCAILAVSATAVAFAPNYRMFTMINSGKGIPLWSLFAIYMTIDFITTYMQNKFLLPSHWAAVGIGYIYAKGIEKGKDMGAWMHWIYNEFLGNKNPKPITKKNKLHYEATVVPFNKNKKVNQLTVDEILDKINQKGIESLTKEEQRILKEAKDKL
jgi:membrane associated rhomboid family serine protease